MNDIRLTEHDFLIASEYYKTKVNSTVDTTAEKKLKVVINKRKERSNIEYFECVNKFLDLAQQKGYIEAHWNNNLKVVPCGYYAETTYIVPEEVLNVYPHMHEKIVKMMDYFMKHEVITSWDIELNNGF